MNTLLESENQSEAVVILPVPLTPLSTSELERVRSWIRPALESIPTTDDVDELSVIAAAVLAEVRAESEAIKLLNRWRAEKQEGEYAGMLANPPQLFDEDELLAKALKAGGAGFIQRFYYYAKSKSFFMEADNGEFFSLNESSLKRQLSGWGITIKKGLHDLINQIQQGRIIDFAGEIAGKRRGPYNYGGSRTLIEKGPVFIQSAPGSDSLVMEYLKELLDDPDHPDQFPIFLNWLSFVRKSVLKGERVQIPAMAIAGPRSGGKTTLTKLIDLCLSGRHSHVYNQFSDPQGKFNEDSAQAELLLIDDSTMNQKGDARAALAQSIKNQLYGASIRMEGKFKTALTIDPVQALLIVVNDDPAHIRVLPETDETMKDKLSILKAAGAHWSGLTYEEWWKSVRVQLPAFLHRLENHDLSSGRDCNGRLKCFWHPGIMEMLSSLSPEMRLLDLLWGARSYFEHPDAENNVSFDPRKPARVYVDWIGGATDLKSKLISEGMDRGIAGQARTILPAMNSCGMLLAKLARNHPKCGITIHKAESGGRPQIYRIDFLVLQEWMEGEGG